MEENGNGNGTLRALIDLRDRTLQKSRVAFGNRALAIEQGRDDADDVTRELVARWTERFNVLEEEANADIANLTKDNPIVQEMIKVKGIGKMLAAKIVCMIDIHRADTVSALWRYCGYGLINGERERPTRGEKLHYNSRLKTTCYLVGTSFLKSNSPYRQIYDAARDYYQIKKPDWTKGHCHNAAMRKMIKIWLQHLWLTWRKLESLPTNTPYVFERLNHTHYRTPEEFGWRT